MNEFKTEYSIDMIRLKTKISHDEFGRFAKKYSFDSQVDYWTSTNFKDFHHNFKVMDDEGSFWVGYAHNSQRNTEKTDNLMIEYNPNKVQNAAHLQDILKKFFWHYNFEIASCDVAIDLHDINMKTDVLWDKGQKKSYREYKENGTKTIYMGRGDNQVRIYDKAREQGLEDHIQWTRYEVSMAVRKTADELKSFVYDVDLPQIYVIPTFKYDFELTNTDWCLLQGLINGVISLDQLGRGKRKKIKTALDKQSKFKLDNSQLSSTLKDYVFSYLLN